MRNLTLVFVAALIVVSLAVFTRPSEAKVIYTATNQKLTGSGDLFIDFNADGTSDVDIHQNVDACDASVWAYPHTGDGVIYTTSTNGEPWAAALNAGYLIGADSPYAFQGAVMSDFTPTPGCPFPHGAGYWLNAGPHYLGVQFTKFGKVRFGWVQLSVTYVGFFRKTLTTTLTGYAYQTIVGRAIKAGQT